MSTWTFQPFPAGGTLLTPALHTNGQSFYAPTLTFSGAEFFPRVKATATGGSASDATNHTITLPSFAAGDLIVIIDAHNGGGTTSNISTVGWTELLTVNRHGCAYRLMDGTEGSTVTLNCSASSGAAWVVYVIDAGSFDAGQNPELSAFSAGLTTTPDPPNRTASWGADNNLWITSFCTPEAVTVSGWPYTNGRLTFTNSGGSAMTGATCYTTTAASAENPGAFTKSSSSQNTETLTLAIRGYTAAGGGATLFPSLHTNSQSFFGPTIRRTLKPSLHADGETFYTQSLRVTLKPALFADGETFYTHTLRRTIRPAVHTNTQAFFGPTLRVVLKPSLFSDGDTFFGPTISLSGGGVTIAPSLHVNSSSFPTHAIRSVIKPAAHVNAQVFRTPVLRATIKPANWVNSQAFQTQSVRLTLKPGAHANTQVFATPRLVIRLSPAAYTNPDVFFGPTISTGPAVKSPALHVNAQAYYRPTIISIVSGVAPTPLPGGGAPGSARKPLLAYREPPPLLRKRIPSEGYVPKPVRVERVRQARIVKGPSKGKTVRIHKVEDDDDAAFIELLKVILAMPE